jgi:hypothetical protein
MTSITQKISISEPITSVQIVTLTGRIAVIKVDASSTAFDIRKVLAARPYGFIDGTYELMTDKNIRLLDMFPLKHFEFKNNFTLTMQKSTIPRGDTRPTQIRIEFVNVPFIFHGHVKSINVTPLTTVSELMSIIGSVLENQRLEFKLKRDFVKQQFIDYSKTLSEYKVETNELIQLTLCIPFAEDKDAVISIPTDEFPTIG